jgi:hypothetical protein
MRFPVFHISKGMRELLLGGSGSDNSGGEAEEDDFFLENGSDSNSDTGGNTGGNRGKGGDNGDEVEEKLEQGNMSFSFVPGQKDDKKAQEAKERIDAGLVSV